MENFTEYTLSIDDFNKPEKLQKVDAICLMIMRLILLSPGSIQSHPEMGVGLITKYRFMYDTELSNLKNEITKQISKYLPDLNLVGVELTLNPKDIKELIIEITISSTIYVLETVGDTIKLSEL